MYGKMLVLTFEDNEDDMMSHILSLINIREEIIQLSFLFVKYIYSDRSRKETGVHCRNQNESGQ